MKFKIINLIFCYCFLYSSSLQYDKVTPINSIIGDKGYQKKYHKNPTSKTNNYDRIISHLEFVIDSLNNTNTDDLNGEQLFKRKKHIESLQKYLNRGLFPQNIKFSRRKPIFVDEKNTHCAVAYLLKKDEEYNIIDEITHLHNYDYISDMNSKSLNQWVMKSGLTFEEVQMIQPSYRWRDDPPEYEEPRITRKAKLKKEINPVYIFDPKTREQDMAILSIIPPPNHKIKGRLFENLFIINCMINLHGNAIINNLSYSMFDIKLNEMVMDLVLASKWDPAIINDKEASTLTDFSISLCVFDVALANYINERIRTDKRYKKRIKEITGQIGKNDKNFKECTYDSLIGSEYIFK